MAKPISVLFLLLLITITAARHCYKRPSNRANWTDKNEKDTYFAPFMVAIYNKDKRSCSGVIGTEEAVVTTATCCHSYIKEHETVIKYGSTTTKGGKSIGIEQVYPHPDYDPQTRSNDLCLIILDGEVEWSEHVQPLKLPVHPLPVQDSVLLYTWKNDTSKHQPKQLKQLLFHHYNHTVCQKQFPKQKIDGSMLCANIRDRRDVSGTIEMGAPIQIHGYIYGLASINLDWKLTKAPILIFTDIYHFIQFIRDTIEYHRS